MKGIDINHITFTLPTITCYSDACEHGLGGYIVGGVAWRYQLPDYLVGLFSINLLELIAASLTIQLAIELRDNQKRLHRILAFTDNSSALCWLLRSNFDPVKEQPHDKVSRDLAWFCMDRNVSLFAQHIKGINNIIADSLSRDFHLSDIDLTNILCSHLPLQHQSTFKIIAHPRKITSWLSSLRCGNLIKKVSVKKLSKSKLPTLTNGDSISRTLDSEMFGSDLLARLIKTSSWQDLQTNLDKINMVKSKRKRSYWEGQWMPPSVLFQRPFVNMHS